MYDVSAAYNVVPNARQHCDVFLPNSSQVARTHKRPGCLAHSDSARRSCFAANLSSVLTLRVCDTFLPIKQEREREAARAREKERERESADRAWSSLFGSATAYRAGIIGNMLHVHRVTYPGSCLSARLRHFPANQARARERGRESERERERERERAREKRDIQAEH